MLLETMQAAKHNYREAHKQRRMRETAQEQLYRAVAEAQSVSLSLAMAEVSGSMHEGMYVLVL
jgi:hypothetical protein